MRTLTNPFAVSEVDEEHEKMRDVKLQTLFHEQHRSQMKDLKLFRVKLDVLSVMPKDRREFVQAFCHKCKNT